jgi:4-carboxymuconolactone decarboxylase
MQAALGALRPPNPRHPFPSPDPGRPKGLNLLGTFAHHTDLTQAFHTLAGHALFGTTLSERHRELLVLRVAAVRSCEYEWIQHLVLAADAGITEDEIAAVRDGNGLDGAEQALLDAVDELLRDAEVSEATWSALAAELGTQQLMDLVFTVGTYDALAMAMKSFAVELDDDLLDRKRPSH